MNRWLRYLIALVFVQFSSLLKISFIVGSQTAFFNGVSMVGPLLGAFFGPLGSILLFVERCGVYWCAKGTCAWHLFAFIVPGVCASLYFSMPMRSLICFWLPVVCMIAFWIHPVGRDAFPYALYWLIPITLYCARRTHIAFQALGATFVAHAVGSVIWLYTVPMTAALWISLIPVVALERAVCVAGMVSIYYAYGVLSRWCSKVYHADAALGWRIMMSR